MKTKQGTTKQVVVMRTDLNMRKGKMVAQGAHAALGCILQLMQKHDGPWPAEDMKTKTTYRTLSYTEDQPLHDWLESKFTKVCVSVDSEKELLDVYNSARRFGLNVCLITDEGLTEFNGVPTVTCLAIGPDEVGRINEITGHLKLL